MFVSLMMCACGTLYLMSGYSPRRYSSKPHTWREKGRGRERERERAREREREREVHKSITDSIIKVDKHLLERLSAPPTFRM